MTHEFNQNTNLNQNQYVKSLITKLLNDGISNKIELYNVIEELEPKIPRSTIRRITAEYIVDLYKKAKVLNYGSE